MIERSSHDLPLGAGAEPTSDSLNSKPDLIVTRTDRRETPRLTAENLAYIHLEPDSGAIVLNVSDGGLCFHAVAPLHQTGAIRFWFSLRSDQRIEALGEIAWTDDSKKTGGLRFTSLPAGAREQISKWVSQSPPLLMSDPPPANVPLPVASLVAGPDSRTADSVSVTKQSTTQAAERAMSPAPPPLEDGVLAPPVPTHVRVSAPQKLPSQIRASQAAVTDAAHPTVTAVTAVTAAPAPSGKNQDVRRVSRPVSSEASSKPAIPVNPATLALRNPRNPSGKERARSRVNVRSIASVLVASAVVLAAVVLLYPARHRVNGALSGIESSAVHTPDSIITPAPEGAPVAPDTPVASRASQRENQLAYEIKMLESEYDSEPDASSTGNFHTAFPARNSERNAQNHSRNNAPSTTLNKPRITSDALPGENSASRPSLSTPAAAPDASENLVQPFAPTGTSGAPVIPSGTQSSAAAADPAAAAKTMLPSAAQAAPSPQRPDSLASSGVSPLSRIAGAIFGINSSKPPESAALNSGMYFDVGEFKDMDWAERATNELAQSGFQTQIVHKGRLWLNSYHVLVGPYQSDEAAENARLQLESQGFKPRFAR